MSQMCAKYCLDLVSDQNFHLEHETLFLDAWGKDLSAKGWSQGLSTLLIQRAKSGVRHWHICPAVCSHLLHGYISCERGQSWEIPEHQELFSQKVQMRQVCPGGCYLRHSFFYKWHKPRPGIINLPPQRTCVIQIWSRSSGHFYKITESELNRAYARFLILCQFSNSWKRTYNN